MISEKDDVILETKRLIGAIGDAMATVSRFLEVTADEGRREPGLRFRCDLLTEDVERLDKLLKDSLWEVKHQWNEIAGNEMPYLQRCVANIDLLVRASVEKRKVLLRKYECNERNRYCDYIIEPFDFPFYYNFVWAYDCRMKRNILLRSTRMNEVQVLDENSKNGKLWILDTKVCDYRGITESIMGLLDEVEILEGEEFREYVRKRRRELMSAEI